MLAGLDLAPEGGVRKRGCAVLQTLYAAGLVARIAADTLILAPALIAEQ